MEKPNKLVAIVSNINGGCEYVAIVKNVKPSEYATLLSEQRQHEQAQKTKIFNLEQRCDLMCDTIAKLEKEIKVLKGEDENEESIED